MALIVQKFGGTSVGDVDRMRSAAARVAATRATGHRVVVVVALVVELLDAGQQEHLVVHGQAEGEREDDHRDRGLDPAR